MPIVDALYAKAIEIDPDLVVEQVKEKFGGLRFYYDSDALNVIDKLVDEAEEQCWKTCEACGAPGVLRGGGWLMTACDEHSDGRAPLDYDK